LNLLTSAALKAAPIKSTFVSKLTDEGIRLFRESKEALDTRTLVSKFRLAVTKFSNDVLYLNIIYKFTLSI
jgi:hypothetical protein